MVRIGDLIEASNDPIKLGAIERNREFIRVVRDSVSRLMIKNQSRMGLPKGQYLDTPTGISSYYGYHGREIDLQTYKIMIDHLRILVLNQMINLDDSFPIRQIDWWSGSGAWVNLNNYGEIERLNRLGLPARGQFTPTDRRAEKFFDYMTFTGTDVNVLAVMGDHVSELKNLSAISYNIHRPKPAIRKLGKTSPAARARASRTIAGSLIFIETDEDPILPLYPSAIVPKDMEYIKGTTQHHQGTLLPDQLPAFDLALIWQNEYGAAKQMIIYGIEIIDQGKSHTDKDMVEEVVYQWVALDIDLPRRVQTDASGAVDPFGITDPGFSAYWQRRWLAAHGLGIHEDPFELTSQYFEEVDTKFFPPKPNRPLRPRPPPSKSNTIIIKTTPDDPNGHNDGYDIDVNEFNTPIPTGGEDNPPPTNTTTTGGFSSDEEADKPNIKKGGTPTPHPTPPPVKPPTKRKKTILEQIDESNNKEKRDLEKQKKIVTVDKVKPAIPDKSDRTNGDPDFTGKDWKYTTADVIINGCAVRYEYQQAKCGLTKTGVQKYHIYKREDGNKWVDLGCDNWETSKNVVKRQTKENGKVGCEITTPAQQIIKDLYNPSGQRI